MDKMLAKQLRKYIIPFLILTVTLLADTIFSPESGLLKSMVTDEIHIAVQSNTKTVQEEEEDDTLVTLPSSSRSLLYPWIEQLQKKEYTKALLVLDSLQLRKSEKAKYQGISYYYWKKYIVADSLLAVSIILDSSDAETWFNRGRVAFKRKKFHAAEEYSRKAIATDSLLSGAHFYLGRALLKEQKYDEAANGFAKALEVGYAKDECWYYTGLAKEKNDPEGALFALKESIRYNPKTIKARLLAATLLDRDKKYLVATKYCEDVLAIRPKHYKARLDVLHIYLSMKEYHKASQHLAVLKQQNPRSVDVLYEEAKLLGLQGRDKAALAIYKEIAKMDSKNPRVYYNMGVNLMDLGHRKKAVSAYKKALAVNEYYWQAAYNLGVHYLKRGKLKSARLYLKRAHEVQPEHVGALYNLGLVTLKKRDYSNANSFFTRALSIDASHYASRYNLILSLIKIDEFDAAKKEIDYLLSKNRNDEKAIFQQGLIALKQKRYEEAETQFQQVALLDSTNEAARYNLMLVYEKSGAYDKALVRVNEVLAIEPKNKRALLKKGEILLIMKAPKKEIRTLTKELARVSLSLSQKEQLAKLYEGAKEYRKAAVLFKELYGKKGSINARRKYAKMLVLSGKQKEGLSHYEALFVDQKLDNETLLEYAHMLIKSKKRVQASTILKELVEKKPKNTLYRKELASLYMKRKRYRSAAKSYHRLARLTKEEKYIRKEAFAYLKADSYEKSLKAYKKLLKMKPKDWDAMYHVGLLYNRMGKSELALQQWDSFSIVFPKDARGYYQKGKILYAQNDYGAAKKEFNAAYSKDNKSNAPYYLAMIYHSEGNNTKAEEYLQQYIKLNPDSKRGLGLLNKIKVKEI